VTCPACGQALSSGPHTRCPHCAALLAGPAEGALAPSPHPVTPPAPMREIPGLRKRERTWKDEVRDRVRHRRQQRGGGEELPLFRDTEDSVPEEPIAEPAPSASAQPAREESYTPGPRELGEEFPQGVMEDLPLRRLDAPTTEPAPVREERIDDPEPVGSAPDDDDSDDDYERDWRLDAARPDTDTRPVERPAQAGERAQAALVDVILMLGVWAVVVYFASRAARVSLTGLQPSWPYLLAYLAFLGLAYAACFTGITGQTLGKMLKGLRVVNASGRPPGCPRAFFRAALGSLGVLLAFGGIVPMFFDPARRGFHDRLLKTRVVRSVSR